MKKILLLALGLALILFFPAGVTAQTAPDTAHFEGKVEAIEKELNKKEGFVLP
jgi:hypothetical protein